MKCPGNSSFTDDISDRLCLAENSKQRVDGGEHRVGDRSERGKYRVHQPAKHRRYTLKGLCHEIIIFLKVFKILSVFSVHEPTVYIKIFAALRS
jgi:hypothetical protein